MAKPDPVAFATAAKFRAWLEKHHSTETALSVRIFKTHAAEHGVTYSEALDEALCFGWIDGVRHRLDDDSFSIRFTPRKRGSIWSLVNVRHVERLIQSNRMHPAGMKAFESRTPDKTGVYSFERAAAKLTPEFTKLLKANAAANQYFSNEAPWYRRTATHWVMNAKREETRAKRMGILIDCSAQGVRIGPLRRD